MNQKYHLNTFLGVLVYRLCKILTVPWCFLIVRYEILSTQMSILISECASLPQMSASFPITATVAA